MRRNEGRNQQLYAHPVVVDDLGNDSYVACVRASFEEHDCGCLNELLIWKSDQNLPRPTSTKRVKFDSSYGEQCQMTISRLVWSAKPVVIHPTR
jgi:hypothetical protein